MNYNQATLYAATGKDLIKVPTQVSDWNASKFIQTRIGDMIAPVISTTNNTLRTNKRYNYK